MNLGPDASNLQRSGANVAGSATAQSHSPSRWIAGMSAIAIVVPLLALYSVYIHQDIGAHFKNLQQIDRQWHEWQNLHDRVVVQALELRIQSTRLDADRERKEAISEIDPARVARLERDLQELYERPITARDHAGYQEFLTALGKFHIAVCSEIAVYNALRRSQNDTDSLNAEAAIAADQALVAANQQLSAAQQILQHNEEEFHLDAAANIRQIRFVFISVALLLIAALALVGTRLGRSLAETIRQRDETIAALDRANQRWQTLVENLPGATFRFTYSEGLPAVYVSEGIEKITGYTAAESMADRQKTFVELIDSQEHDNAVAILEEAAGKLDQFELEYRIRHRDGTERWIFERGRFSRDPVTGEIVGDGVMFDVTQHKLAEERVRVDRANLAAIIEAAPGPVWLSDADLRVIACNQALADRLGLQIHQVVGRTAWEMLSPIEYADTLETVRASLADGKARDCEFESRGQIMSYALSPILDDTGKVVRLAAFGRDVTKIRRNERALAESERFMREVTAGAPGAVYRGREGRDGARSFPYMSKGVEQIVGISAEEVMRDALAFFRLVHPDDLVAMEELVNKVKRDGGPMDMDFRVKVGETYKWIRAHSISFIDTDGATIWDGLFIDVTSEHHFAENLLVREKFLREVTAGTPGAIYRIREDRNGQRSFPFVSQGIQELLGVTAEEVTQDAAAFFRKVVPGDMALMEVVAAKSRNELSPLFVEFRVSEGERTRWLRAQSTPSRESDGSVVWDGLVIDVTREKAYATELADSEQRWRTLVANLPGATFRVRIANNWEPIHISDWIEKITGYPASDFTGKQKRSFTSLVHPEDIPRIERVVAAAIREGGCYECEYRITHADGTPRWVVDRAKIILDPLSGEVVADGVLFDITEAKRTQLDLAEKEHFLRDVASSAPGAIFRVRENREANPTFQWMSSGIESLVGVSAAEILENGVSFFRHVPVEDRASFDAAVKRSKEECSPLNQEFRAVHSNQLRWLRTYSTPHRDDAGMTIWDGVIIDVTDEHRLSEELRERERQLQLLTDNSADMITRATLDGRITYISPACTIILGYLPEELIGVNAVELLLPEDRLRSNETLWKSLEDPLNAVSIERLIHKTGKIVWTESRWTFVNDPITGERNEVVAVTRDITRRVEAERERENMERALRISLTQLHTLVQSAVDGILILRSDGAIESANPAAERIFSATAVDLVSRSLFDLLAEPHRAELRKRLRQDQSILDAFTTGTRECLALRGDKYVFPIDLALGLMKLDGGDKYVAVVRDITERKLAENRIVEDEARLQAILSSAADGIIVTDAEGRVRILNDVAEKIFAIKRDDWIHSEISSLSPALSPDELRSLTGQHSFETTGVRSDGMQVPLQFAISRTSVNEVEFFTIIVRDLTEEYKRRQQLIESDKMVSIATLAAGVAHEFKNYLAAIIGNASFARDCLGEPDGIDEARDAFDQIIAVGERANQIALSLLNFSGQRSDQLDFVALDEVVASALRFVAAEMVERQIIVRAEFQATPLVRASTNRLQQVILNLLLNAAQAINRGGEINVMTRANADKLVLSISDTGIGIPEENLSRIFDPFFSTKGVWGKDATHGTGLGLSISRNIISSYGGEILVESEVGKGSTFSVLLPIDAAISPGSIARTTTDRVIYFGSDAETAEFYASECASLDLAFAAFDQCEGAIAALEQKESVVLCDAACPFRADAYRLAERALDTQTPIVLINSHRSTAELHQLQSRLSAVLPGRPSLRSILGALAETASVSS